MARLPNLSPKRLGQIGVKTVQLANILPDIK